jgi:hypothetical protein
MLLNLTDYVNRIDSYSRLLRSTMNRIKCVDKYVYAVPDLCENVRLTELSATKYVHIICINSPSPRVTHMYVCSCNDARNVKMFHQLHCLEPLDMDNEEVCLQILREAVLSDSFVG